MVQFNIAGYVFHWLRQLFFAKLYQNLDAGIAEAKRWLPAENIIARI